MRTQYVLAASRPWFAGMAERLQHATGHTFYAVSSPDELNVLDLATLNPRYIFVPHWSWILPDTVWTRFETVIFHMTDLPFGRGGSPLQNLIVRGYSETMITALRCTGEVDAGPVYAKTPLSLLGSAEEIFLRAAAQIESMIISIVRDKPVPVPQNGEPVLFNRRTPKDGDISALPSLNAVHDHIRMLDAEGYPAAFLQCGPIRIEFKRAALRYGRIETDATITFNKADET